jgi:hypothetical protein
MNLMEGGGGHVTNTTHGGNFRRCVDPSGRTPRPNAARGRSFCRARLPAAGLGNKLFVWARARVFSRLNSLPLVVSGWSQIRQTAIHHGGDLRLYLNYFRRTDEVGWVRRLLLRSHLPVQAEPAMAPITADADCIYAFAQVPHWSDYFRDIRDHRALVQNELWQLLTPARQQEIARITAPAICVNVRLGDFRKLKQGESFAQTGGVRTPIEFIRDVIEGVRAIHGQPLSVWLCSDGTDAELADLLRLPNVQRAPRNSKIGDIYMMARSNILVHSAGSTFGYWASFLGDNVSILHPDHVHQPIRPAAVNERWFEGGVAADPDTWPELLKQNIRQIDFR